jgi:hypothetical protein
VKPGTGRRLKRTAILAAIVVALAMPTTAGAAVRHFEGRDLDGGAVSFKAKLERGHARRVAVGFTWKNLGVRCHEGWTDTDGSFTRRMRVHHRRFHGTGQMRTHVGQVVVARVTGRFTRHGKKAHGTIRVHGDFSAGATNCDTGKDHWRAHRALP